MATSCETKRCRAYSDDIRWRIVYQSEGLGLTYRQVAANLCVDVSTVSRVVRIFEQTGCVSKKVYDSSNLPRKLTEPVKLIILQVVLQRVGITLAEIRKEVNDTCGVDLSESAICQFLHTHKFSRQRIKVVAAQRDDFLRHTYASEVCLYKAHMFIFMDETGTDRRDKLRKYGYSMRGKPPITQKILIRGQHLSSLAIMSTAGVLDCQVVTGGVTGDVFYQFVQQSIVPHLMPFNGSNPHSIVVMDNAAIHHVDGVADLIQATGALIIYLPPYSPDYNPIEHLFSKLKTIIKTYESQDMHLELESIVYSAFCQITQEDCCNWISHSGIYST